MDGGSLVLGIATRRWDILRNRRIIFILIWTPFTIVLFWLAIATPWIFFLVSPFGIVTFSVGVILSVVGQVHSELGWSSRLPVEIPSRENIKRTKLWHLVIIAPIVMIGIFIIQPGMEWLRAYSPAGLWIIFNLSAGLVTFILGVLIAGFLPSLLTQLYWEHKVGKIIVKQGKYWVGIGTADI